MIDVAIILMVIIFIFGAFIKGWVGFGTNLVVPPLLLFLTRFDNLKEVMIIVVTVNVFLNLYMIIQGKNFNLKFVKKYWVLFVFGVLLNVVGVLLFNSVNPAVFKILLGIMILLVTLNKIFKFQFSFGELTFTHFMITGIISGVLNGLFGLGGIPLLILLSTSKVSKQELKSLLVTYFFVMNIIFILLHGFIGQSYNVFVLNNILIVFGFALIACAIGVNISSKVNDKLFQRVMNGILIFFGINLIYSGIFGEHIFNLFS